MVTADLIINHVFWPSIVEMEHIVLVHSLKTGQKVGGLVCLLKSIRLHYERNLTECVFDYWKRLKVE